MMKQQPDDGDGFDVAAPQHGGIVRCLGVWLVTFL
jgi:hypothetical protein